MHVVQYRWDQKTRPEKTSWSTVHIDISNLRHIFDHICQSIPKDIGQDVLKAPAPVPIRVWFPGTGLRSRPLFFLPNANARQRIFSRTCRKIIPIGFFRVKAINLRINPWSQCFLLRIWVQRQSSSILILLLHPLSLEAIQSNTLVCRIHRICLIKFDDSQHLILMRIG